MRVYYDRDADLNLIKGKKNMRPQLRFARQREVQDRDLAFQFRRQTKPAAEEDEGFAFGFPFPPS